MAAPASRLTQNTLSSQACDTVHRLKGAVCQIDTKSPGTGFLVTPNCLLTCCHVLPEKEIAQNAYACFSDIQEAISVALNPDPLKNGFYHASKLERSGFTAKHLDFVLVALSQTIEKASDLFVLNDQFPPQKERIHVIQHPVIEVMKRDPDTNRPLEIKQLTGEKRIATGQVTEFDQYTIHHTAPVAGGASGAPIVNDAGHLYAFHQAECTNPAHKKCSNPEHNRSKNPVHKDCEIQVNCGIGVRTDAVFRYLKSEQISLDVFDEQRKCAALKAKYAKQSHLELVRPVRGYKDWILKFPIEAIYTELVILHTPIKKK